MSSSEVKGEYEAVGLLVILRLDLGRMWISHLDGREPAGSRVAELPTLEDLKQQADVNGLKISAMVRDRNAPLVLSKD